MSDGFWFDGVDLGRWLRANPRRSMTPPVRHTTIEVPGRDGEFFAGSTLGPLEIPVDVRLRGSARGHREVALERRALASALLTVEPARLVLPDEPGLYYMAVLSDPGELDNLWHTGGCTLTFTAYDPVAHGRSHTLRLSSGDNRLRVLGSWETWPRFTLTSTGGRVRVERDRLDRVALSATAARDAIVTIDMEDQVARINGNLSAVDLESDFFPLSPGDVTVTLVNAKGSLTYEERWA